MAEPDLLEANKPHRRIVGRHVERRIAARELDHDGRGDDEAKDLENREGHEAF